MPWGRLDDQANGNAKLLALSDSAYRMWACGLIYCQANLTDGFIPGHAIHSFGVRAYDKPAVVKQLCARLVPGKSPLWHKVRGGYQVHDYLDWNDARDKIIKERQAAKDRVDRFRKRQNNGARNPDGNALQTQNEHLSTTTTTGVSKEQKHTTGRGRVFLGSRLKVSHRQHEVVCDELGVMAGHVDLIRLYAEWDADLAASGAEFDTLAYIKQRAGDVAKALRKGGPLYAEPLNESGEDWYAECQRLHDGKCNGRHGHHTQRVIDQARETVPA